MAWVCGAVGTVLVDCVLLAMLLAGVSKAIDLAAFERSLRAWTILPAYARPAVVAAVPLLEVWVAMIGLLRISRTRSVQLVSVLLIMLTTAYVAQWVSFGPPPCSCFGAVEALRQWENSAWAVVGRNVGLLALLGVGVNLRWLGGARVSRMAGTRSL